MACGAASTSHGVTASLVPGPAGVGLAGSGDVQVWVTTVDQEKLLARQADVSFHHANASTPPQEGANSHQITVDDQVKYQQMDGFGASITDASASLLQKRLSPETRAQVMQDLFGREGIHLGMVRQPMGSCDYNVNLYSYCGNPGDVELENFSVDQDRRFILPSLHQALEVNPDLKVIASPWSAPGWMKTSGSIIGGALRPDCHKTYGEYFARFVEEYRAEGVQVYAVTVQNEPLYEPWHYPGMSMSAGEEAAFIKEGLGPAFEKHGLDTRIMVYDHNWDHPEYPLSILDDPEAARYVTGVAWHGYGGSHDAMTRVHDAHPDKGAWFTECSGGEWVPEFHDAFMDQTQHVIRSSRNWAKSVFWWNLALDTEHGPSLLGDWSTCRGLVKVDASTGTTSYNVDYYTIGHASKFVEPGAFRIDSNGFENDLEDVAFQNPDGSKVLIVSNRTTQPRTFQVHDGDQSFGYTLPGEAAATFKWSKP